MLLPKLLAQVIGLGPYLGLETKEVHQVGGGNAQKRGNIAETGLLRQEQIQNKADGGPEMRVLAAQLQSSPIPERFGKIGSSLQTLGGELRGRHVVADLEKKGLTHPPQRFGP